MAGRKRQLFEVLSARQSAGRTSHAGEVRGGGNDPVGGAAAGVEKVVDAGRSAVAWFESVAGGKRAAGGKGGSRAAGASRGKPSPAGVSAPGMPGFSVLAVAFVLLGLGFGIGRWTASPADAPPETQLNRPEQPRDGAGSRSGGPRTPDWVPTYRALQGEEYFARLAGDFYPVVVVPSDAGWLDKARSIVEVLRQDGIDTARIHRLTNKLGEPVLAVGAFWSGSADQIVTAVRGVDARGDRKFGQRLAEFDGTPYPLGE